jgi:hypothetical protein
MPCSQGMFFYTPIIHALADGLTLTFANHAQDASAPARFKRSLSNRTSAIGYHVNRGIFGSGRF